MKFKNYLVKNKKKQMTNLFNDILEVSKTKMEKEILSILNNLFPLFIKINQPNHQFTPQNYDKWLDNKFICTEEYFDKYFTLSLEEDEVSYFFLKDFARKNNVYEITNTFMDLNFKGKLKDALNKLIRNINLIPQENCISFIESIFDIGELIDLTDSSHLSDSFYIMGILEELIKKLNDENKVFNIVKNILSDKENVFTAIEYTYDVGYYLLNREKTEDITISKEHYDELKEMACNKIKEMNENNKLIDNKNLHEYLIYWYFWGHEEEVYDVFDSNINNIGNLMCLLYNFRRKIYSSRGLRKEIDFEKIDKYYDLNKVINKIKEIENNNKTSNETKMFCESFFKDYKHYCYSKSIPFEEITYT